MGGKPLIEQITSLLRNILTYFTPSPKNPDSVGVNPDLLNEGVSYSHVADRVYTMLNDSSTTPLSYFSYISQYDLNELREINNEFGKRDYCYVIGGLWCFPVSMMTMTAYHLEEEDDVFHYNMIFELYQTAGLA